MEGKKRYYCVGKRQSKAETGKEERESGGVLDGETEVATADFTWVLYVPGGEVGLSAPPSDKGTEGSEEPGGGGKDQGRSGGERRSER